MRANADAKTPFDQGAQSVLVQDDAPNPYPRSSRESRNFELGRAYALQRRGSHDTFVDRLLRPSAKPSG